MRRNRFVNKTILRRPESQFQLAILYYLKARGFEAGITRTMGTFDPIQKIRRSSRYTFRGFPDITCFTPKLVFIEVKSPTGRQSEEQKKFQRLCAGAGIKYILAKRLEDVERGLEE